MMGEVSPWPVVLLTDFGVSDPYVGIMKGVLASQAPNARLIDLSHEISPQNVRQAAFFLRFSISYFPKNTLFICVVDPGVGSKRNILWAKTRNHQFLAPDNGLLSWIKEPILETRIVSNSAWMRRDISSTFHGRDIFAPVAAKLFNGNSPGLLGSRTQKRIVFPWVGPFLKRDRVVGEIIFVDRFGNCVSNITNSDLERRDLKRIPEVFFRGKNLGPLRNYYAGVEEKSPLALTSSFGLLELAVRNGSFADQFKVKIGEKIECR